MSTKLSTNFINWYDMLWILTFFCMFFWFPYFYIKTLQACPTILIVHFHIIDAHFLADTVWLRCQSTTKMSEKWQRVVFMLWKEKMQFKYFKNTFRTFYILLTDIINNEVMCMNVIVRII